MQRDPPSKAVAVSHRRQYVVQVCRRKSYAGRTPSCFSHEPLMVLLAVRDMSSWTPYMVLASYLLRPKPEIAMSSHGLCQVQQSQCDENESVEYTLADLIRR